VAALPERRRVAFTLCRRHYLSYAEIAEVMGTTVKTVEGQIGLALKALRKSLADWLE
jgi:RNA polymerase sigma-70 factor (ECF subfamily)